MNDTYGHHAGDRVLIRVAEWLCEQAGEDGHVGRLGGDEFIAVVPVGSVLAEAGDRAYLQAGTIDFSVSMGRAEHLHTEPAEAGVIRADLALYQAKAARPANRMLPRKRPGSQPRPPERPLEPTGIDRSSGRAHPLRGICDHEELHPVQVWVVDAATRGLLVFTAVLSTVIVALAVGACVLVLTAQGLAQGPGDMQTSASIAALVCGLVTPPVVGYLLRLVIRLAHVSAALRHAAVTDPLTELLSRPGFFQAVNDLDEGLECEVIMIDLNDFKLLNDSHGHEVGDRLLRGLAQWLRERIGPQACAARMGGDEFACVVLPGSPLTIVDPIQQLSVDGVDFSVSLGRAPFHTGDSVEDALFAADTDMYRAKSTHRSVRSGQVPRQSERGVASSEPGTTG